MKLITSAIVLSGLGAATFGASALATPIDSHGVTASIDGHGIKDPVDGYRITIPEWEVEVFPGGPLIKVNGTVQEVHRELLRLNPHWDKDYPINNTEKSSGLSKRAFDVSGHFCGGRWNYARAWAIDDGINYLRRVRGQPTLGPGPGNCDRARESKTLQGGFNDVADGARFLEQRCLLGVGWNAVFSGQVFSTSDWNVIVRHDANKC